MTLIDPEPLREIGPGSTGARRWARMLENEKSWSRSRIDHAPATEKFSTTTVGALSPITTSTWPPVICKERTSKVTGRLTGPSRFSFFSVRGATNASLKLTVPSSRMCTRTTGSMSDSRRTSTRRVSRSRASHSSERLFACTARTPRSSMISTSSSHSRLPSAPW